MVKLTHWEWFTFCHFISRSKRWRQGNVEAKRLACKACSAGIWMDKGGLLTIICLGQDSKQVRPPKTYKKVFCYFRFTPAFPKKKLNPRRFKDSHFIK